MTDLWTKAFTYDWLLMQMPKLRSTPFKVLVALSRYVNEETGVAWPGEARLARDAGINKHDVIDAIPVLVEKGCISILEKGKAGRGHSTKYQFLGDAEAVQMFKDIVKAERKVKREVFAKVKAARSMNCAASPENQIAAANLQVAADDKAKRDRQDRENHASRWASQFTYFNITAKSSLN